MPSSSGLCCRRLLRALAANRPTRTYCDTCPTVTARYPTVAYPLLFNLAVRTHLIERRPYPAAIIAVEDAPVGFQTFGGAEKLTAIAHEAKHARRHVPIQVRFQRERLAAVFAAKPLLPRRIRQD